MGRVHDIGHGSGNADLENGVPGRLALEEGPPGLNLLHTLAGVLQGRPVAEESGHARQRLQAQHCQEA